MGCDIHLVLERKRKDGHWVAVDTFSSHHDAYAKPDSIMDGFSSPAARARNYERFARLAGVRGDGPEPRGLPDDISETGKFMAEEDWGANGHSHSWLPLAEATTIFLETERNKVSDHVRKYPDGYYFGTDTSEGSNTKADDFLLVFWFDN